VLLVADPVGPPKGKQEDQILNQLGKVECPLNAAVEQMKKVSWVLLDPLAESVVIICSHEQGE